MLAETNQAPPRIPVMLAPVYAIRTPVRKMPLSPKIRHSCVGSRHKSAVAEKGAVPVNCVVPEACGASLTIACLIAYYLLA
jgi:hypothetical protein